MDYRIIVETETSVLEDTGPRVMSASEAHAWVREARDVYGEAFNGRRVSIQVRSGAYVAPWDSPPWA